MLGRNRRPVPAGGPVAVRPLVGMIAAGLLLGGVASVLLRAASDWAAPPVADAQATANDAAVQAPAGAATGTTQVATPVTPPTSKVETAANGKAPSAKKSASPKPTPAGAAAVQLPTHLDDQVAYQYNALGRRDPFQSLLTGEYVGSELGGAAPPDVGGLKVVGIVWGDADQFALVEDARGDSHILRRGDKVMNGFVESLKRDAMVVNLTLDGQSHSVRVPLTRKGDKANASR